MIDSEPGDWILTQIKNSSRPRVVRLGVFNDRKSQNRYAQLIPIHLRQTCRKVVEVLHRRHIGSRHIKSRRSVYKLSDRARPADERSAETQGATLLRLMLLDAHQRSFGISRSIG